MQNSRCTALNIIFLLVEGIFLIPPIALEYLSTRKMGVIRYLVYLDREYGETYLSNTYLMFYKIGVVTLLIISLTLLISYYKKKRNSNLFVQLFLNIVLNSIGVFFIFSKDFYHLNAYLIFLASIFIVLTLQNTRLFIEFKLRKV